LFFKMELQLIFSRETNNNSNLHARPIAPALNPCHQSLQFIKTPRR
jgi:hypothetical protein